MSERRKDMKTLVVIGGLPMTDDYAEKFCFDLDDTEDKNDFDCLLRILIKQGIDCFIERYKEDD